MKILYITEATGWTGGANQIWLTSQELIKRGHPVAVACRPEGDLAQRLQKAGVKIYPLRIFQDYDVFSAFRLSRIAHEFQADLLHAHHPQSHAMALLASYFRPLPVIVTRRVIYPIPRNPFSAFKYRSRKISKYVAVCQAATQELILGGVEKERISVIPSAVEINRWESAHTQRNHLNGKKPAIVTMVGHYAPIKGHEILLRAAAKVLREMPQTIFRLVGRDTEKLRALAQDLQIANQVEILGERSDVPELLSQTHLYVMPSLMEGIGTSLIEAQAAGVPVVASEVGGLPDVVDKDETGVLVPPGNPKALAEAILKLLTHPQEAEKMALKGYEKVKRMYSLKVVVDQLEELYKSVL
ncbi:MAG: glycosyltransferase family 4 protein [Elusimicrobia bacterium]|nr:glycosyltransferase family 4 protein [Elusimicrobiota bacterium]